MLRKNTFSLQCYTVFMRVWQQLAIVLKTDCQLHLVSVAGFAGTPAFTDPLRLTQVTSELAAYIQQPVLLSGAGGALPSDAMRPAVQALYQQQMNTLPQAKLDFNWQARHFMMWDQPEWLLAQITDFIKE